MNYADETARRLEYACPLRVCVLNGVHELHRNAAGNQWPRLGHEGIQNICSVTGCVLLVHKKGSHQDQDGEWFLMRSDGTDLVSGTIRNAENVEAFRDAVAILGAPQRAPHSEHYAAMTLEPITVIDAWGLNFNLGCVVKYLARPKGQTIADLEKAVWYLQRELAKRRNGAL